MDELASFVVKRKKLSFPVWLVVLVDVILMNAGYALAFLLRFGTSIHPDNLQALIGMLPFISSLTAVTFASIGLYSVKRQSQGYIARLLNAGVGLCFMSVMAVAFWQREFAFPRSVLMIAPIVQLSMLHLWRMFTLRLERRWHGKKKLLLVGYDADVKRLLPKVKSLPVGWVELVSVHAPEELHAISNMVPLVDAVLVTERVPLEIKKEIIFLCFELAREVYVVPDLYDVLLKKSVPGIMGDTPIMEVPEILMSPVATFVKRGVDVVFAVVGLVVSSPLWILVGLAIVVASRGPILYTQERVGRGGRRFWLIKFRTMIDEAEKLTGPVLATKNDSRVTTVGRVLRATRLDELPQLLNVLRGDMSLVGPRPERPEFVQQYLDEIPEYRYRYLVRPGLTGLAQVRGRYSTAVPDKLRYDLSYIVNYTILLDLKVILETVPVVFSNDAAAGCDEPWETSC